MVNMSIESDRQDPNLSQSAQVASVAGVESEDSCQHGEHMCSAYAEEVYNFYKKPISNIATITSSTSAKTNTSTNPSFARISGRNKRKNFNPRCSSSSPMSEVASMPIKTDYHQQQAQQHQSKQQHQILDGSDNVNNSSKSPPLALGASSGNSVDHQPLELTTWMQMFHQYNQLVKATSQPQMPSGGFGANDLYDFQSAANMSEWLMRFGTTTSIRDIFKFCQGMGIEAVTKISENGQVAGLDDLQLPSRTTNCLSTGLDSPQIPFNSPARYSINVENSASIAPYVEECEYTTNLLTNRREGSPSQVHQNQSLSQTAASKDCKGHKIKIESLKSYHDENSNYGERPQSKANCSFPQLPQLHSDDKFRKTETSVKSECENSNYGEETQSKANCSFPDLPQLHSGDELRKTETSIKSECDDTDPDITLYDEDDYPSSSKDFLDSTNDEDDDDVYSLNMFCDDEKSTIEDHLKTEESAKTTMDISDVDDNRKNPVDSEGNCSLKISVRNLGGFFHRSQVSALSSKRRGAINVNAIQYFVRNMIKFMSYVDCQNEVCRLENLREHYHCYDFPCFGKILSKKEEVIRHVKWHRKRIESLNHGFMRFSTSDDCSTSFGGNCQHNRKQTHYHCFQPNCDRVYISTSDVQMHSNFHRKNSAIHKEGFQRFRANEECSAEYCMFVGQKTTHFHCRRENCRHTFKNKADMEKHKTYHIKDLKLAQDGFKKFLKNEPCPYSQCRFSKVCNHIHCARENCFYVLNSSGQLLSHKRKHERMDNEQTYCRYKMLAVKAALLGNTAASTVSQATKSLLPDFEASEIIPSPSTELPIIPSKKDLPNKDWNSDVPLSVPLPFDFLQNIKKQHGEMLKHNLNLSFAEQACIPKAPVQGEVSPPESPQSQLTPSMIEQFFTADCPACSYDEPINLKSKSNVDEYGQANCTWKNRSEQHLHCILKDCKAGVSNNLLEISEHVRMHGFTTENMYDPSIAPQIALSGAENNSEAGTAHCPMQITTIDGFFNRKRGRPPKNRFVEVYRNAQQSPQAIFTSFKLEKQTLVNECNSVSGTTPSSSYSQQIGCRDNHQRGPPDESQRSTNLFPNDPGAVPCKTIGTRFTMYKATEECRHPGGRCPLAMQHHYHCFCSPNCTFVTVERDLLNVHMERRHTNPSFADVINQKFKRYDRNVGLDCGIVDCQLRKTRPHLHCRRCQRQISPFDIEIHVCYIPDQRSRSDTAVPIKMIMSTPTDSVTMENHSHDQHEYTELTGDNCKINSMKNHIKDYESTPKVEFSTLAEMRHKGSEMNPEIASGNLRSQDDEKVLVVRAAGTYFPENTTDLGSISSQLQQKLVPNSSVDSEYMQIPSTAIATGAYCLTPYCKMKRKPHEHCECCDQSYVDPAKMKAHRLKHATACAAKSDAEMMMSLHSSTETTEDAINHRYLRSLSGNEARFTHGTAVYDDQPQDLSVPLNSTLNEVSKLDKEQQFDGSSSSQVSRPPSEVGNFPNLFHPNIMCSISMRNFHLAQLASFYQQNSYYNQHIYPFVSNAAAISKSQQDQHIYNDDKLYFPASKDSSPKLILPPAALPSFTPAALSRPVSGQIPLLSPHLIAQSSESVATEQTTTPPLVALPSEGAGKPLKRKLPNSSVGLSSFIDALSPTAKKQMQLAAGLAAVGATSTSTSLKPNQQGCSSSVREQRGQHFKIRYEQIPTGYLKFRFNEDCFFPKCGYRNHQSHFHCDRNDCHYSFCDKTRFVQHTARHERLDKLMGNDFRQYRAKMNCGYENCPYFKNLGSANKSSHFHCLKCEFICSDTNKVVAHRRQHSKMEYIRLAGFRKVTNSEKCTSHLEVPVNGNEHTTTVECSYSQKQTHYHCLVCDVSVLSRTQLASHKHKT